MRVLVLYNTGRLGRSWSAGKERSVDISAVEKRLSYFLALRFCCVYFHPHGDDTLRSPDVKNGPECCRDGEVNPDPVRMQEITIPLQTTPHFRISAGAWNRPPLVEKSSANDPTRHVTVTVT